MIRALVGAACALTLGHAAQAMCETGIDPVVRLEFGSRYIAQDDSRSTIDTASNQAVTQALKPVDDFIRHLVWHSNTVLSDPDTRQARAACVLAELDSWALAGALSELNSFNARLAVGGRIAGIAEIYRQIRPYVQDRDAMQRVDSWLSERARSDRDFWEKDATSGARDGNLRAWSTLGVLLVGDLLGDDAARYWAYASATRILCTARQDGSLPQETKRGRFSLHYQFHALAPLVMIAARAAQNDIPLPAVCDNALRRAVNFALRDQTQGGVASRGYSGQEQWFTDRSLDQNAHAFAWLPAYLSLSPNVPLAAEFASRFDGFNNSKLGGDQSLLWP